MNWHESPLPIRSTQQFWIGSSGVGPRDLPNTMCIWSMPLPKNLEIGLCGRLVTAVEAQFLGWTGIHCKLLTLAPTAQFGSLRTSGTARQRPKMDATTRSKSFFVGLRDSGRPRSPGRGQDWPIIPEPSTQTFSGNRRSKPRRPSGTDLASHSLRSERPAPPS